MESREIILLEALKTIIEYGNTGEDAVEIKQIARKNT